MDGFARAQARYDNAVPPEWDNEDRDETEDE